MDLFTYAMLKRGLNGGNSSDGNAGSGSSGGNTTSISWKEAPTGGVIVTLNGVSKILAKQDDINQLRAELNQDIAALQSQLQENGGSLNTIIAELNTLKEAQILTEQIQSTLIHNLAAQEEKLNELEETVAGGSISEDSANKLKEIENLVSALSAQVAEKNEEIDNNIDALTTKLSSTTNATSIALSGLRNDVNTLKSAIRNLENNGGGSAGSGSGQCNWVFDTLSDMNLWLESEENVQKLSPGSHLFIKQYDVADYWWDGEKVQQVEVQIDLSPYVKKTDYATDRSVGLVQGSGTFGISVNNAGVLKITTPDKNTIKTGINAYLPITPSNQDLAVFYGLGKTAGVSSSDIKDNLTGGYSEAAQQAIQKLLGLQRQYVTKTEFEALKELGLLEDNIDYYVYEEE